MTTVGVTAVALPLADQLAALKAQIRTAPGSVPLRVHYFQLLCVLGEWTRALEQLQLCAQLDPTAQTMARAYREVIRCEVLRQDVFAGKRRPFLIGEPAAWMAWMIDALALDGTGRHEEAHTLRARALQEAPERAGSIGEHDFAWLADSDTRLGPVCELLAQGRYYWLAFDQIAQIAFEPVQDLRDLVWLPCELTLVHGGVLQGFMPVRYPAAEGDDDALKLARRTQWSALGVEHVAGHGQRSWVSDTDDFAMLQVRHVRFAADAVAPAQA